MEAKVKMTKKDRVIYQVVLSIQKAKGVVTPEDIVEKARPVNSPIHSYFEWDKDKAAQEYLLYQARNLLNHVKVIIEGREVNAVFNVQTEIEDVKQRGYYSHEKVLSDEVLYKAVLEEAIREIQYWNQKYGHLKELKRIVNKSIIVKVEKKIKKRDSFLEPQANYR